MKSDQLIYFDKTQETWRGDLTDLSEEHIRQIKKANMEGSLVESDFVHLISVLDGVKPGAFITDNRWFEESINSEVPHSEFYELLNSLPISHRYWIKERNDLGLYIGGVIARDPETLQLAPDFHDPAKSISKIETENQEEYARFLGIPKEDIMWWENESGQDASSIINRNTPILKKEDVTISPSAKEMEYLQLLPYIPEPSNEGVRRAIQKGQEFYNSVKKFDVLFRTSVASEAADAYIEYENNWYTPQIKNASP